MADVKTAAIMDEVLDFLVTTPTPEQIIAFGPSEALQQRVSDLLDRNRSGLLTAEENNELEEVSRMNHFMSMLKIRARKKLAAS